MKAKAKRKVLFKMLSKTQAKSLKGGRRSLNCYCADPTTFSGGSDCNVAPDCGSLG